MALFRERFSPTTGDYPRRGPVPFIQRSLASAIRWYRARGSSYPPKAERVTEGAMSPVMFGAGSIITNGFSSESSRSGVKKPLSSHQP